MAVDKPGRRLYNVRGPMLQEALSVLLQIDAADGNKVLTVRSPLQVRRTSRGGPVGEQELSDGVFFSRLRIIFPCPSPS